MPYQYAVVGEFGQLHVEPLRLAQRKGLFQASGMKRLSADDELAKGQDIARVAVDPDRDGNPEARVPLMRSARGEKSV